VAGALTVAASVMFIFGLKSIHNSANFGRIMMFMGIGMGCVMMIHTMYRMKG
jgi:hypothetical protein